MTILRTLLPPGSRRREAARRMRAAGHVIRYGKVPRGFTTAKAGATTPVAAKKAAAMTPRAAGKASTMTRGTRKKAVPKRRAKTETDRLAASWKKHKAEDLDEYLVSGYQNPGINGASILARHFFIHKLFGDGFDALMDDELRFALETGELLRDRAKAAGVQSLAARLDPEKRATIHEISDVNKDREAHFRQTWHDELSARTPTRRLSVLELACGSANDYRAFAAYGLAQHLDYTGIDLNTTNIANATRRFPDIDFRRGDVMNLPFEDDSYDYVLAFDIFEHLSPEGMQTAMEEAMRVARRGLVLTFFNMDDIPDHVVRPLRQYHWNLLSADKTQELIRPRFPQIEALHLQAYVKERFPGSWYYSRKGWQIRAER